MLSSDFNIDQNLLNELIGKYAFVNDLLAFFIVKFNNCDHRRVKS